MMHLRPGDRVNRESAPLVQELRPEVPVADVRGRNEDPAPLCEGAVEMLFPADGAIEPPAAEERERLVEKKDVVVER